MNPMELLQEFVSIAGPPGKEERVRAAVAAHLDRLGLPHHTDKKGNLIVTLGDPAKSNVVVTAHLDEIAMIVRTIRPDGRLRVGSLGGLLPWKLGEGPVSILAPNGDIEGVLSVGSIHTDSVLSPVTQAKVSTLTWDMMNVVTGLSREALEGLGVRPGTRVVVAPSRRTLTTIGPLVAGYFLDDRADVVSWLLALNDLKNRNVNATFVATVAEEVGGEGALYYLHEHRPDYCIALELGPKTPDAEVDLTDVPTVWTSDAYATMQDADGELVREVADSIGMGLQFQHLSRGGSDASCAASHGLCARPITLGLAMENTHGYEIMHAGAMANLAALTAALVERISSAI